MKIMNCPLNGPRNIAEFVCGGEVREMPDPDRCADAEWADHVFMQDNPAGEVREWWCTRRPRFWFIAERDTLTDEILETYAGARVHGAPGAGLRWRDRRRHRGWGRASALLDRPEPAGRLHLRGPQLPRLRRRHHRQRARRLRPVAAVALVQVSPPARHPLHGRARRQHAGAARRTSRTCSPTGTASRRASRSAARTTAARSPTTAARRCVCSSRFLPVGFYYDVPPAEGRVEALGADHPQLRRPRQGEPQGASAPYYDKAMAFAIVAVVGGGPAGMSAALEAAETRRSRSCWSRRRRCSAGRSPTPASTPTATRAQQEHRRLVAEIEASPNITRAHRCRLQRSVRRQLAAGDQRQPDVQGARAARWSSRPARSSSRWCSATTTCPA